MNPSTSFPSLKLARLRELPGLLLCLALALAAVGLGHLPWPATHGFSALTIAIVLGMLLGNAGSAALTPIASPGVALAKQTLLRTGIVLYGLRLTLRDIDHVGLAGVIIDGVVLASTFGLAALLGERLLRLDRQTALLIGAGSAICGAAAVMAAAPVLRARAEKVTVAVSTVVVFGTLAIFLYPTLYRAGIDSNWLPSAPQSFGVYAGSTIHEVAQVVAAAGLIGPEAADAALIAKMVRVMMLAPFLILLSARCARMTAPQGGATKTRLAIPWFAFLFIGVVVFNSIVKLPGQFVAVANEVDTLLLAMAMAALGLSTQAAALRRAGFRPLLLAALLFGWLVAGGAAINGLVNQLLR